MSVLTEFQPDLEARSPWATLTGVQAVRLTPPSRPVDADIVVPGSKSFTNRALLLAAAATGTSRVSGILRSDDSYWCIDALRRLGIQLNVSGHTAEIHGAGGAWPKLEAELYIGAAGTTARFLPGLLAAAPAGRWLIRGSRRLSERPMATLLTALQELGAEIEAVERPNHLPLVIRGGGLRGGRVAMSGRTSSQFISGVLMAGALAAQPVTVEITDHIVQHAYVRITLDLMHQFGAETTADEDLRTMRVKPHPYQAADIQLEADASTACYFFSLAALTGGRLRVNNLSTRTCQPDIRLVDLLERMGCHVVRGDSFVEVSGTGRLRGGFTVSLKEMSDQALTVGALAVFADAPVTVTEVEHIRHHESDRIRALCESLARAGIRAEEHPDGFTVYPGQPKPATLRSYDDHRVAMSLSLLGTVVPGIQIEDPGCVSKTCPTYFEQLRSLGVGVELLGGPAANMVAGSSPE